MMDLWLELVGRAEAKGTAVGRTIKCWFAERDVRPFLQERGFAVPLARSMSDALTAGLEPFTTRDEGNRKGVPLCEFQHFVNLIWQPIIQDLEAMISGEASSTTLKQLPP